MLESSGEEPRAKGRRYLITAVAFILLASWGVWFYGFRFYAERKVVTQFMNAVIAGDTQRAFQIWHTSPSSSYTYRDFVEDWGPGGYYGWAKSYRIESAEDPPHGGSGTVVVVDLSPYSPYPTANEPEKEQRSKVVRLWVEHRDKSMGFPP